MKSIPIIEKPIYCKSCFRPFRPAPIRRFLEGNPLICEECISQIDMRLETKEIFHTDITFLSGYSGIMQRWLMNFKEYGDIEIAPCFLQIYLPYLKLRFPNYIYLPLPSSQERIKARGYAHLEEILKSVGLPFESVFRKEGEEQKNRQGMDRKEKQGISLLEEAKAVKGKNIVLFDDVLTTGSTFKECLKLIQTMQPKSIKGLILMDNFRLEDLRIHS